MFCAATQGQRRSPVKHTHRRNRGQKPLHHGPCCFKELKTNEKYFEKNFKVFVIRFS
jgi:hypothetical protein